MDRTWDLLHARHMFYHWAMEPPWLFLLHWAQTIIPEGAKDILAPRVHCHVALKPDSWTCSKVENNRERIATTPTNSNPPHPALYLTAIYKVWCSISHLVTSLFSSFFPIFLLLIVCEGTNNTRVYIAPHFSKQWEVPWGRDIEFAFLCLIIFALSRSTEVDTVEVARHCFSRQQTESVSHMSTFLPIQDYPPSSNNSS